MTQPATWKQVTSSNTPILYDVKSYMVQTKPYNLILPMDHRFHFTRVRIGVSNSLPANVGGAVDGVIDVFGREKFANVRNRAYEKLVGKLGDASSLGATLTAERRETWGMFVTVATRALRAAKNIRKLNLSAAARDLGLPYRELTRRRRHRVELPPNKRTGKRRFRTYTVKETYFDWNTGRMRLKTVANGWLMYSYGIKPLMGDMYNSIDALQRPFPWGRFKGRSSEKSFVLWEQKPPHYFLNRHSLSIVVSVTQAVDCRVDNPNLWLANRLGLVNPAQWILEGIPFSFVVDWFSNLSNVVNSLTDFVGLETSRACVNQEIVCDQVLYRHQPYDSQEPHSECQKYNLYRSRTIGLILPTLHFQYERFQWQRGANAISLLVGMLPRK